MIDITEPIPEDAEEIQQVFYKTWLQTYPNKELGITEADIHEIFREKFTKESLDLRKQQIIEKNPNRIFLVAKNGERVVGLVSGHRKEKFNQIQAIYILPEFQRKGIGHKLLQKCLDFFNASQDIIVHVATYNQKAISFYEKYGFVDDGKRLTEERHRMPISRVLIPELEMCLKKKTL
jgi:ribosomal protein S18 acetylase RimI-like enzyme